MKRIAIIGGGISGLSAAVTLEQRRRTGVPLEYVLYESSSRLGGVISTESVDGCVVEAGPDSFLTEKPWATDLCRELGLEDQLIGSNDAERKTYILLKGRLVPIPDGLMFMVPTRILPVVFSRLFSLVTKFRMAQESFHSPASSSKDESVAKFVERHYGSELVERLADPLLSGVYGGDSSQLSVRAVLPRFARLEASHGSLGRAMLAGRKKIVHASSGSPRPLFTSLKDGMQQMTNALAARLCASSICLSTTVQQLRFKEDGWMVSASGAGAPELFDSLIIATPAHTAAVILQSVSTELADELRGVRYTSSITATLGYGHSVRSSLPPGFGLLVPHSEGRRLLAATFVHNKFSHRAPEDRALIRCFFGGSRNEEILQLHEDEILRIAREELRQILGIGAEPLFTRVYKWKAAMAQYTVGHLERLHRIDRLRQQLPGLALAGKAYRGIGLADCVHSGKQAAEQALFAMGLTSSAAALTAVRSEP